MKNLKYPFMVLLGGAMYGTMSSFVKMSYTLGYSAAEVSFAQALLSALFLGCIPRKTPLTGNAWLSLLLTGSAIGLANFLYYQSVSYISASLAIVILMQFTWFSLLLEWLIFRQRAGKPELITVFFILSGTIMAGDLLHEGALAISWQGIVLSLAAALAYAGYIVANSRIGKGVNWQTKSVLIMAGSALTIFVINAGTITAHHHFDATFLLWALFFAIIGTTIPTALFAVGIPKIGAGTSAILMTIEFPVAVLCAHFILHERITPVQIAGIIIMLTAISAMNYFKSKKTN
ncbi:EamA family transporter [Chitinophaga sancti]|uniref:EamA family transporter n=1 Tax=Chitinophaga sancti TaxID=1004 RepID=UPI003F794B26